MNITVKSILFGILLGLAPLCVCTFLFYVTPLLLSQNAGTLLSFAVMGLFCVSFVATFIISIVLISKKKELIGKISLLVLLIQIAAVFYILAYT